MATKTTKTETKGTGHGAGWSGVKGQAICDLLAKHPDWTRCQIAGAIPCTVRLPRNSGHGLCSLLLPGQ